MVASFLVHDVKASASKQSGEIVRSKDFIGAKNRTLQANEPGFKVKGVGRF